MSPGRPDERGGPSQQEDGRAARDGQFSRREILRAGMALPSDANHNDFGHHTDGNHHVDGGVISGTVTPRTDSHSDAHSDITPGSHKDAVAHTDTKP